MFKMMARNLNTIVVIMWNYYLFHIMPHPIWLLYAVPYRWGFWHQVIFRAACLYGCVNPHRLIDGWLLHTPWVGTLQYSEGSWVKNTDEVRKSNIQ